MLFFSGGLGGATGGGLFNQQQTQTTGLGGVGSTGTGGIFGGQQKVGGSLFGATSTQQVGLGTGGLFGGQTTQAGSGLFGGGQRPGGMFSQSGNTATGFGLGGTQVHTCSTAHHFVCTHAYTHVHARARAHTHIHTHTHTNLPSLSFPPSSLGSWEEVCSTSRVASGLAD